MKNQKIYNKCTNLYVVSIFKYILLVDTDWPDDSQNQRCRFWPSAQEWHQFPTALLLCASSAKVSLQQQMPKCCWCWKRGGRLLPSSVSQFFSFIVLVEPHALSWADSFCWWHAAPSRHWLTWSTRKDKGDSRWHIGQQPVGSSSEDEADVITMLAIPCGTQSQKGPRGGVVAWHASLNITHTHTLLCFSLCCANKLNIIIIIIINRLRLGGGLTKERDRI